MAADPTNLRHLFGDAPTTGIDVSTVIRRSRARRAPRLLGAGTLAVLALGSIAFGGFTGIANLGGATSSDAGGSPVSESSDEDLGLMGTESNASVAELYRCGEPVSELLGGDAGLLLAAEFPAVADLSAPSIDGTITMTNVSAERVMGTSSAPPTITLVADGLVVGQSPAGIATLDIDLAPGESIELPAAFSPVLCSARADGSVSPAAGDYELYAVVDFATASGSPWVSGPARRLTLE